MSKIRRHFKKLLRRVFRRPLRNVTGLALVLLLVGSAVGDQHWESLYGEVSRGEVVPLEAILDWLEERYVGDVIEVEVEREGGYVEYEIKLLGPQGQVVAFEFDGHNGQLMSIEGVRINDMRR